MIKMSRYQAPRCNAAFIVCMATTLFLLFPAVSFARTEIFLREKNSGSADIQVSQGDTVAIEVVVDVDTIPSQGVAFFISFDEEYFSVVDQGSDTLIIPFDFSDGVFGNRGAENNTHGDPGNGIDRFQLDGSIIKSFGDFDDGEGVVAVFYLVATADVETSLVSIDYDLGNHRDTRLHIVEGGESVPFNFTRNMHITVGTVTGIEVQNGNGIPAEFSLKQNYPNPFNPETKIEYSLPAGAHVSLKIYNTLGQLVKTLLDARQPNGRYSLHWDGRDASGMPVSSGIYFYRLTTGTFQASKKMLLLR